MKESVTVWEGDALVEIDLIQRSETVWVASGKYLGNFHEVEGKTKGQAKRKWIDAAHYHSN